MKKLVIALTALPFLAGAAAAEPKQLTDKQMHKSTKRELTNVELDKVAAGATATDTATAPGAFAFAFASAFGPITFVKADATAGVLAGGVHFASSSSTSSSTAP